MIATLAVLAACSGDNLVAPDEPEVNEYSDLQALEGNVSWFCWIDGGTGEVHSCEFWCEGEGEELTLDDDGYYVCVGPSEPEPEDPPGPGTPGSPEADTAQIILTCDKDVVRGTDGGCTLSYPSQTPISNIRWEATVPDANPQQTGGDSWDGEIVTETTVRVDFDLSGAPGPTKSGLVTMKERTTGKWSSGYWSSQITVNELAGPVSCYTARVQAGGRLGLASKAGTCASQDMEWMGADGVDACEVTDGGPNDGLWWICDAGFWVDSETQIHPGIDAAGTAHTLALSSQRQLCNQARSISPLSTPVTINFYDYNKDCAQVANFSGFPAAVQAHERAHFDSMKVYLLDAQQPQRNLYQKAEKAVGGSEFDAVQMATQGNNNIRTGANVAGSVHPTGNWNTPFWLWDGNPSTHEFLQTSGNTHGFFRLGGWQR